MMISSMIWAVPGFLGLPSDWDHLQMQNVQAIDPFAFPWHSLEEWAKQFNALIRKKKASVNILMGYSLGGRLALHALLDDPSLWDGAIIVSAHPGIYDPAERDKREAEDLVWADLFLNEEWGALMQKWSTRPVFKHETFHFKREEKDFKREELAHTLIYASQGRQKDLTKKVGELTVPQLWLVGENDARYFAMSKELNLKNPDSKVVVLPDACHRIPWSHPQVFKETIQKWTQGVSKKARS